MTDARSPFEEMSKEALIVMLQTVKAHIECHIQICGEEILHISEKYEPILADANTPVIRMHEEVCELFEKQGVASRKYILECILRDFEVKQ